MKFGITKPAREKFDPIKHLNLNKYTVTIDSIFTNFTIFHYNIKY